MTYTYYAMTMPGLETTAFTEIHARFPDAAMVKYARGIVLFTTSTTSRDLLSLRTTEDIFLLLVHLRKVPKARDTLKIIHAAAREAKITDSISIKFHMTGKPARSWRVVSQMIGEHGFRRKDVGDTIRAALRPMLPKRMHEEDEYADTEFWSWAHDGEILIGLRLSTATMRHREYKIEHQPGSLRPTIAAAMAWLSHPTATDQILDPLCGSGTILIERALLADYQSLIGGDIDREAVAQTVINLRAAHRKATIQQWDSSHLPIEDQAVTSIITNLPFGKKIGSHEENQRVYPAFEQEFRRVLKQGGALVTLTSDFKLWKDLLIQHKWSIEKTVVVVVLGQPATIAVAVKSMT